jgi:hypothetical protein
VVILAMESQELFAQAGLQITAFQIARLTGMSQWCPLNNFVFSSKIFYLLKYTIKCSKLLKYFKGLGHLELI